VNLDRIPAQDAQALPVLAQLREAEGGLEELPGRSLVGDGQRRHGGQEAHALVDARGHSS
jgi:hypothetical protein